MNAKLQRSTGKNPRHRNRVRLNDTPDYVGSRPLLLGESRERFDRLYEHVREAYRPRDAIEEIWVHEYACLQWELDRLRRLKWKWYDTMTFDALKHELEEIGAPRILGLAVEELEERDEEEAVASLVRAWVDREPQGHRLVREALNSVGQTADSVAATALLGAAAHVELLDGLIRGLEVRRNVVVREFDRHREAQARHRLIAPPEVEDVEFEDVTPPRSA